MGQMIFRDAKQTDLVIVLAWLGFEPASIKRQDYWYRSPFRNEHTASFKVNRHRNIWFDHGEGIGGNVIDFAARFFQCDAKAAAEKILGLRGTNRFSFHPPTLSPAKAGEKKENPDSKIVILNSRTLQNGALLNYLLQRKIPLEVAQRYCVEVDFSLYGKQQTVIGFKNRSGGFELRSEAFKGSSAPKDVTILDSGRQEICVYEGFFDFLAFATIRPLIVSDRTSSLVLNSLSFFEKSRALMEQHNRVFLFLDQGNAGRQNTQKALTWNKDIGSVKYTDSSQFYRHHDDLNAWLVAEHKQQEQQTKKPGIRR